MKIIKRTHRSALVAILMLLTPVMAKATPADDFHALLKEHWAWWLETNPIAATSLGVRDHDSEIGDISLAEQDREAKAAQAFLDRLERIPADALTPADRINRAIMKRMLAEQVEANGYGQRMILLTTYAGWHQDFAGLADNVPLRRKADFESYLKRLEKYPGYNDEAIAVTAEAVKKGFVQPCAVLGGYEKTISGVIADDPAQSRFYAPFAKARPVDLSDGEWAAMQARARELIRERINPAYRKWLDFYLGGYLPKCRKSVGAAALPGGKAWYAFRARAMTTTDLDPERIHQIGLSEVKRIRAEMDEVAAKAGFASREAFIARLRTDPQYYPGSADALMQAAALMAKTLDGKMPGYFKTLPRLPYGVRAIPAETAEGTTTAYYNPGSPASGIAGTFYVNTSKLDQRPLYELPALTAHEAVPGHHNQIALQQELDLPAFRKHAYYSTAYVEGWGLYSEHLGIEMGLYDTPEKDMGRLSYEMWRACRLVVDTGLHAKGWSKAQAIAFMTENTALSAANIEAEVNRYISWPGQALAYKIGELKIRDLRQRAEQALGARFDLRAFHDAVLAQGAVPMDVLETEISEWIDAEAAKPSGNR